MRSPDWNSTNIRTGLSQNEVTLPNGKSTRFVDRSQINKIHIFTGRNSKPLVKLRKCQKLANDYGGIADKRSHTSGEGFVNESISGMIKKAEIHWMEEPTVSMR